VQEEAREDKVLQKEGRAGGVRPTDFALNAIWV
jgi:hypothetical protein